jgi:uncharacterized protein YceH (UPF0502 family)
MYPLTLNALRLACNQSTNREPVVDYDDAIIRDALHHLERRGFARLASGRGSRAPKYRHLLAEALPMSSGEQALMCVLMLRGPQTPGELKQRADRMHAFTDLDGVHETLEQLIDRGLAVRLERRPGQKEERYSQLLEDPDAPQGGGGAHVPMPAIAVAPPSGFHPPAQAAPPVSGGPPPDALAELSERVERLERELSELRAARGSEEPAGMPR